MEKTKIFPATARERVSFNSGWRFAHGDPRDAGEALGYERLKPWVLPTGDDLLHDVRKPRRPPAGPAPRGFTHADPAFEVSHWRTVELPHDWGVESPFDPALPGDTGKLPWFGVAWYRKTFPLPASDAGRRIYLELDGAMSYATVWCNGDLIGGWPYGYSSWRVELTGHLKPGADNTLAVRLENPRESSRWYPGGGLYRNIWLLKTAPVAIAQWGVSVATPKVTETSALVSVSTTVENATPDARDVSVSVELYAADTRGVAVGSPLAAGTAQRVTLAPGERSNFSHTLRVANPRCWDLKERHRHVARVSVCCGGGEADAVWTPFGIRTLAHTATEGFLLNGRRVPLRGVCNHHDLGALGAAVNERALERQLEILQAMGCNALRTSHNPPAPELLELCDRMGFLVMVEAFDCWRVGKKRDDYGRLFDDWHEKDLRAMVRRDRNHPCVVQWSIGNEILEQFSPGGWTLAALLAGIVREEDRTRPVTAGLNGVESPYRGFQLAVDVVGFNYKPQEYARLREVHPHLPVMGAETASCISSRGEYMYPVSAHPGGGRQGNHVSSYDLYAPEWATSPDVEFAAQDRAPHVMGEFVWTGFDYLGEPTPYGSDTTNLLNYADPADRALAAQRLAELGAQPTPSRSSYFGIVDLAGFPKDRYYLYQARWRPEHPMAHLLPHWTWPEAVGRITPVHVYTSGDEAELFLNGQSLGRKRREPHTYRLRWDEVVYAPGELRVVAYRQGRPWAEDVQVTAGPEAAVQLIPDRPRLRGDGRDLVFVTARIVDADGRLAPRAARRVRFVVDAPAEIAAVDNGDPTDLEAFQSADRRAFNGLALAIVRARSASTGRVVLRAEAEGLGSVQIELDVVG
jgi:beta-galactosidase